jgi:hypothetical protein
MMKGDDTKRFWIVKLESLLLHIILIFHILSLELSLENTFT